MKKLDEYFDYLKTTNLVPSSAKIYRKWMDRLWNYCKSNNIHRVTTKTIKEWTDYELTAGEINSNTMSLARAQVSRYYKWMVAEGHAKENPVVKDKLIKIRYVQPVRHYCSLAEYKQIIEACRTNRRDYWTGAVMVAWNTGLRLSDIAMLRWDSIEPEREIMRIKLWKVRRFNKVVEIPIDPDLYDYLTAHKARRQYESELVFPQMYGYYQHAGVLASQFMDIREKAGLPHLNFHSFRHAFISRMLNAGVDSFIVADLTGLTIEQLSTYAHISTDAKRDAMHKIKLAELNV